MKSIRFAVDQREIETRPGESVLDALIRLKIPIDHSCGGFGSCGTCRMIVTEGLGRLEPRNEVESEIATDRDFSPVERLACQTTPVPGLRISLPKASR